MSLTTVAAPLQPNPVLAQLPSSRPERFQRSDFIAAALVFLITFGVYIATLAPNVTLEDSGELITAATKFGVPHPPGYPTWTLSGFILSHLIPFGSLAWRMNLQSAIFGAAANAVLTLLVCHSGRWLLQRWSDPQAPGHALVGRYSFYAGLLAGLTLGFSNVMWSQAVFTDVRTLNGLFVNLVLILFYFWMLAPQKTHRLILTVFVFGIGLTHHHTLIQFVPAMVIATFLLRAGKFWPVFLAINLFSLTILVYLSWLSSDEELHQISQKMAVIILGLTAGVSFFFLREFRLRLFLIGAATVLPFFAYAHYLMGPSELDSARFTHGVPVWQWGSFIHPGWMQITTGYGVFILLLAMGAIGLLFSSTLDRRLILAFFAAGWVGLTPYAYESFASSTHPPMNWGFASERSGFYYAVSREQYPMSLPNLIKSTVGKVIGVVPLNGVRDEALNRPNYFHRLSLDFYYYGENLEENFTVPLIFLILALLLYMRRSDAAQVNWIIFLGAAFFFLGFMLHLIEPPEAFDFERNLQYKVFNLPSHSILVLFIGYGALASLLYLHENLPEISGRTGVLGFGMPALFLCLLPLWNNFDDCSQAGHWFGYNFGADIMRPMEKNAVYFGGSDPGRFVPTFMAFVESQQPSVWKREPNFDRRDVAVITQNALCDTFYSHYIRDQYDPRFRPAPSQYTPFEKWLGRDTAYPVEPVTCVSDQELSNCWREYERQSAPRLRNGGPLLRPGSNDVFELNGVVAREIFEKNKATHTFYIEQSVPIDWMYPYLLPSGLILKLNPQPLNAIPPALIEADHKFWDAYSADLLSDPKFRHDEDATLTFSKLAFWHADLYAWRGLEKEQEYWLKLSIALCPQLQSPVDALSRLYAHQQRFDEAMAVIRHAEEADPRNELYAGMLDWITVAKQLGQRERDLRAQLAKSPYDVDVNLQLARLLQTEGRYPELNDRLRIAAGLTNWDHDSISDQIIEPYVTEMHNPQAAIAFLQRRAEIDPKGSELIYGLAVLEAGVGRNDEALKHLVQSATYGGTNALISASVDPRLAGLRSDPRFQALLRTLPPPPTNHASGSAPSTNQAPVPLPTVPPPAVNAAPTHPPVPAATKKPKHP